VDFTTISNQSIRAALFYEAILPNSNFEDVDMSDLMYSALVFKNKAYLYDLPHDLITKELFGDVNAAHLSLTSKQVRGNDLALEYFIYNSFAFANLENANFKNAVMKTTSFASADLTNADLTNADLSGADLRSAFLGDADLSNTNLDGANLQGAILDNAILTGANLKCINHSICNS
jgi:uncharacterized protein YjbI with pentapeptide repeats